MTDTIFIKLNSDWNAEPNDPGEKVSVIDHAVELAFNLNPWAYKDCEGERACLQFRGVAKWRLGPTNDEGWYRGRFRYCSIAHDWGEFYEIMGTDALRDQPDDWQNVGAAEQDQRHFLFYLKDSTFECIAADWSFNRRYGKR